MDARDGRFELAGQSNQRHHHLQLGPHTPRSQLDPGAEQGLGLRRVQLGPGQRQPHAAQPQHRVDLVGRVTEELVQRSVEQAHGDRTVAGDAEQVEEVLLLRGRELDQGRGFLVRILGEQEPPHERQPVAEELVLGAAQAHAFGAGLEGRAGVAAVVGVGPHAQPPQPVRSLQQQFEVVAGLRWHDGHRAGVDHAGAAVHGNDIALGQRSVADSDKPRARSIRNVARRRPPAGPGLGPRPQRAPPALRVW